MDVGVSADREKRKEMSQKKWLISLEKKDRWKGNRQEGQGSPNWGNSLQVSDIFISLKRQEETN